MGGVDAKKLHACMSLFLRVDSDRLGRVFDWKSVLRKYYGGIQHKETDEKLNELMAAEREAEADEDEEDEEDEDDEEDEEDEEDADDEDDEEEQRRDRPWH